MGQPLSKGNMVLMKGDKRASGKFGVAAGAIENFLRESKDNRAVYVSLSNQAGTHMMESVDQQLRGQLSVIAANESNDSESYLAPM